MQVFELRHTPKQYTYSKKTHLGTQENYFLHMHCFRYSPLNSSTIQRLLTVSSCPANSNQEHETA